MSTCEKSSESLLNLIIAERSDKSAHDRAMGTVRTNTVHNIPTCKTSAKKKNEAPCGRKSVAKLLKQLQVKLENLPELQIYNELDCYRDSHVKLESESSEEKRRNAHISLWRSVDPHTHGHISIMERIFGTKAWRKMDYFLASDARRVEIKKNEVKMHMKKAQDFGCELYPDGTCVWSPVRP